MEEKIKVSYIEGESIGDAYLKAFTKTLNEKNEFLYLIIHIKKPIKEIKNKEISDSNLDIENWLDVINVEEKVYETFIKFEFSEKEEWSKGKSGKDWINGRIKDLLHSEGCYNKALRKGYSIDQLAKVEERLKYRVHGKKLHGGTTNALVCNVFLPEEDLKKACQRKPQEKDIRCLTQIDFKPVENNLNLIASFRSQYFDTKAYGNLIALAILLYDMCKKTQYEPGEIISTAHKALFYYAKDKENLSKLLNHFREHGLINLDKNLKIYKVV
jgi:thymidylate synthase